jgi:hypothetical protein
MMTVPTVDRLRANDPILTGVDLSGVTFRETPIHVLEATAVEIAGSPGGSLIYRGTVPGSDQPMVVLTFDVGQSNLPSRIAFPILVANIVQELTPGSLPPIVALGSPVVFEPGSDAESVTIVSPSGVISELPVPAGETADDTPLSREIAFAGTSEPGTYRLFSSTASGRELNVGSFVVNAGHPRESDLRSNADLPAILTGADGAASTTVLSLASDLWPALVAAAVLILLIEWGWLSVRSPGRGTSRSITQGIGRFGAGG